MSEPSETFGAPAGSRQPSICTVTVTVHAPTAGDAASWAQTISDLVSAEYGQEMRLDVHVGRPAKACCGKDIGHHVFCPTRETSGEGR